MIDILRQRSFMISRSFQTFSKIVPYYRSRVASRIISVNSVRAIVTDMPPKRKQPPKEDSKEAKSDLKSEENSKNQTHEKKVKKGKNEAAVAEEKPKGRSKRKAVDLEEPKSKRAKKDAKPPMNKTVSDLDAIDFGCSKLNAQGEKYNLKICSWNISGIRAVVKKNGYDYIAKEDADIVALQEIKCEKHKLPKEVHLDGYHSWFLPSNEPGYSGVALYSKQEPIGVTYYSEEEGRVITAEYKNYYLINVYVPNAGRKLVTLPKRLLWNENFKRYIKKLDEAKPVIICGDMNVAHQEIDLTNPKTNAKNAGFTKEERDGMTDFLESGYVDTFRALYPDKTGAYTFWSYLGNARSKNVGWRLDYFLVSERIKNKVCDNVMRDKVYGSDHCPIVLYINV